jgi:hypothetical protein
MPKVELIFPRTSGVKYWEAKAIRFVVKAASPIKPILFE